jgi:crotonobetainyl-CoA:carnitine CoA-transferase CaiB-like acyl-CoA transferase
VPYTKVFNIKDVLADPQAQHRQSVMRIEDPDLGSIPAPCVVPRISGASTMSHRSGPAVGEHNADFFGKLGLSSTELVRLKEQGVI